MYNLLTLTLLGLFSAAFASCYTKCRFHVCSDRRAFWMPAADMSFTGELCDKKAPNGWMLSRVNSGEALIRRHGRLIPISQWAPNGLTQKFSKHFFKTAPEKMMMFEDTSTTSKGSWKVMPMSGIQHEVMQGNQGDYVLGKCFVLPLNNWQYVNKDKIVQTNINDGADRYIDCVSFITRT